MTDENPILEIRTYRATEGKFDALLQRFVTQVVPRLPNHGIELVGLYTADQPDERLVYLTRFAREEDRVAGWKSFGSDPDWLAAKAASEADGPLLERQEVTVLSAVDGVARLV